MAFRNDAMHNVYTELEANGSGGTGDNNEIHEKPSFSSDRRPVLMLDAHLDECGFMIQSIMEMVLWAS